MATLYRHQRDGTYYTRIYRGGIVTRQIHPDGVAILKQNGVTLGDEIPAHLISLLDSRGMLYTKEEMYGWGQRRLGARLVHHWYKWRESVRMAIGDKCARPRNWRLSSPRPVNNADVDAVAS